MITMVFVALYSIDRPVTTLGIRLTNKQLSVFPHGNCCVTYQYMSYSIGEIYTLNPYYKD